jgi:hypothetical protein
VSWRQGLLHVADKCGSLALGAFSGRKDEGEINRRKRDPRPHLESQLEYRRPERAGEGRGSRVGSAAERYLRLRPVVDQFDFRRCTAPVALVGSAHGENSFGGWPLVCGRSARCGGL